MVLDNTAHPGSIQGNRWQSRCSGFDQGKRMNFGFGRGYKRACGLHDVRHIFICNPANHNDLLIKTLCGDTLLDLGIDEQASCPAV